MVIKQECTFNMWMWFYNSLDIMWWLVICVGLWQSASRAVCFPLRALASGKDCQCTRMGWISTGQHHRDPQLLWMWSNQADQWRRGTVESLGKGSHCSYSLTMGKVHVTHDFFHFDRVSKSKSTVCGKCFRTHCSFIIILLLWGKGDFQDY